MNLNQLAKFHYSDPQGALAQATNPPEAAVERLARLADRSGTVKKKEMDGVLEALGYITANSVTASRAPAPGKSANKAAPKRALSRVERIEQQRGGLKLFQPDPEDKVTLRGKEDGYITGWNKAKYGLSSRA